MSAPITEAPAETPKPGGHGAGSRRLGWLTGVLVTLAVHAAAFFALSIPAPRGGEKPPAAPVVQWVGAEPSTSGTLLGERLTLFDNAPLFLPTPWNTANADFVVGSERSPGEIFGLFEPVLVFAGDQRPGPLSVMPEGIASAAEGLGRFDWRATDAFGRRDREVVPPPPRLASLEVRPLAGGEVLLRRDVPVAAAPNGAEWPDWAPFEVLVTVEPMAGRPTPVVVPRGSGSGVVDGFFRDLVWSDLRLDLWLPQGNYRVVVGP